MKQIAKSIFAFIMSVIMVTSVLPSVAVNASATDNIVIDGVDIGYAAGEFFTKNGESCADNNNYNSAGKACASCHKRGDGFDCTYTTDTSCNCMRYWPTGLASTCKVDLGASQCFGYARYCQWIVYGKYDSQDTDLYEDLTGAISNVSGATLKSKLKNCSPATHVRTYNNGHSISIVSADESGVVVTDCNNSSRDCHIEVRDLTWDEFATELNSRSGILYAYSYKSGSTETPDTPVVSDTWYQDYNPNYNSAITPELIQAFLESKSGGLVSASLVNGKTVLDINGTYYDLGFDSYYAHTNTIASSNPLKQSSTGKVLTPAQIIYYACVENNMNVVWILANLQKEQSLIGSIEDNYQTRLNRAVGYMKFENDERSHYEAGEKYYGFIGQVIGATYQFSQYIKDGTTTMAGGYEKYTPSSESGNMAFSNFKTNIYDKYAEWFDANMEGGSSGTEYLDYPVITSPSVSKTYTAGNDITFTWDDVDGADYYLIGVKDETSGETLTGEVLGRTSDNDNVVEGTSCTLDGEYVIAGHKYKFAVGANSNDGNTSGGWSSVTITVSENSEVTPDDSDENTDYGTVIDSGTCGDNLTWEMYDSGTLVISGKGDMTALSASAYPWYVYIGKIEKVIFNEGITSIASNAFYNYDFLKRVVFSNDLLTINQNVFTNCDALMSVTIPEGVTSIGKAAFENCGSLTNVDMGKSVTSIGASTFSNCTSLTAITIPDSLTSIGSWAFDNTAIRKVYIPESVVSVHSTVYNISTITSFEADNEDNVGYYTVDGVLYHYDEYTDITTLVRCPQSKTVRSFIVPEEVDVIGSYAFRYNDSLASITFHDNITAINSNAFEDCDALTSVTIPEGVTSIGKAAFESCGSLTNVDMGKSVTSIGTSTFSNCTSLTAITIPDSLTSIGSWAFDNTTIRKVYIPESVVSVHSTVYNISTITSFEADNEDNVGYYTVDGVLCHYDEYTDITTLVRCPQSKTVRSFIVPEEVDVIGSYAFRYNDSLASITFHDNITAINSNAFEDCDALTSVTIPEGVTSIGKAAFENCSLLNTVVFPAGLTKIESSAFGNTALIAAYFYGGTPSIGSWAFENMPDEFVMYYIEGNYGWTSPTWNGYNTATFVPEDTTVSVIGVKLNKSTATLTVGSTTTLTATVMPSDATDRTVKWTSSNTTVATVSGGKVTAVNAGTAVITATTTDGGYTASCTITVNEQQSTEDSEVVFTIGDVTGKPGDIVEVEVSVESAAVINSIALHQLTYDTSVLTFVGFTDYEEIESKCIFTGGFDEVNKVISLALSSKEQLKGKICKIKFQISESAEDGDTVVQMASVVKCDATSIASEVESGTVTILTQLLGDISGDNVVDINDALRLFQYSMIPDVYPISYAGSVDFNKDGVVDIKDALRLFQYSMIPDVYPIS